MFILTNTSKTLTFGIVFLLTLIYNPKLEGKVVFPSMFSLTGNAHACWLSCDYRSSTGEEGKGREERREQTFTGQWPELATVFRVFCDSHNTLLRCWEPHFLGYRQLGQPASSAQDTLDLQTGCIHALWLPWQITTDMVVENNTDLLSYSPGSQKFKMSSGAKIKVLPRLVPSGGLSGEICFLAFFSFWRLLSFLSLRPRHTFFPLDSFVTSPSSYVVKSLFSYLWRYLWHCVHLDNPG